METPTTNDRAAWLYGPSARCAIVPPETGAAWRLILLGAPGVGKGTQATLLSHRLGACHLSTGDVFRVAASPCQRSRTPAMTAAVDYMCRGELVPDATVWELVRERVGCIRCGGGFVLDGFPRTISQANALEQLLDAEQIRLHAVINYDLPTSEIVERLSGRRVCEGCRAVYHIKRRPPQKEGICDTCGGKLFIREDDRPESIEVRLKAYQRDTTPVIDFFGVRGLLLTIPAEGAPDKILEATLFALGATPPLPEEAPGSCSCACKLE